MGPHKSKETSPEKLPSNPHNSLFGTASKQPTHHPNLKLGQQTSNNSNKKKRHAKTDPALALAKAAKTKKPKHSSAATNRPKTSAPSRTSPAAHGPASYPPKKNAEAVAAALRAWEELRAERTTPDERAKLVDAVLAAFGDSVVDVLHKHDAARVLQSCYRLGTAEQRDELLRRTELDAAKLALSHYGHFFLLCMLRHGPPSHRGKLLAALRGRAADLIVHADGSAVLQLAYSSVATPAQRVAMYRELWGKDFALLPTSTPYATLAELFTADPACKPRVLRHLEALLGKAARKGLAMTHLVQRGLADMLELSEPPQRAALAATLVEAAPHIMHERNGARVACACVRHVDAKQRKALLKAVKGYVVAAASNPHGALFLCACLEVVDDTVLLRKCLLSEMLPQLAVLAAHSHGSLPLLAILAPRSARYFTAERLQVLGDGGASKKDSAVRRAELLSFLLPPLIRLCAERGPALARSPHGGAVVYEALSAARDDEAFAEQLDRALRALAEASTLPGTAEPGEQVGDNNDDDERDPAKTGVSRGGAGADAQPVDGFASLPLATHPYGARLLKRLVQAHDAMAAHLLRALAGSLRLWAEQGAGWLVLSLLEAPSTRRAVTEELRGAGTELAACGAEGCRSLGRALPEVAPEEGRKKLKKSKVRR